MNSGAVQREWFLWNNEQLKGGDALELIQLENLYGTEKLVEAIHAAGCADRYGKLTINFVKKVLARILGGAKVAPKYSKKEEKAPLKAASTIYDGEDEF